MAIVEMQKLGIYSLKKNRKQILEFLQSTGAMEIDVSPAAAERFSRMDTSTQKNRYEKIAENLDHCVSVLKQKVPAQSKKLLNLEKRLITRSEMNQVIEDRAKYYSDSNTIISLEKDIEASRAAIAKKENKIAALTPWLSFDLPLNYSGTRKTSALIGSFPAEMTAEDVLKAAVSGLPEEDGNWPVDVTIVSTESQVTNVCVICTKRVEANVEAGLREAGFSRLPFLTHLVPKDAVEKRKKGIAEEKQKIRDAEEEIISYGSEIEEMKAAADYFRTRADKYDVLGQLPQSKDVFFVEGWIPKPQFDRIRTALEEKFDAVVDPETVDERDVPAEPVLLHNNKFSESAEGVLESYGLPQHGRVDPTFIMSIFYVFFFGMMLSDAGYGILISVICGIVLLKNKRMESGLRKMLQLFFWCGLSTTFWGFMYGGFFGDAIDTIAHTFFGVPQSRAILKPIWFAPLGDPMRLLIWCMLFGIIHLFAGLGIKGYEMLKAKDVTGFLSDIVSWYLFLIGLILMLLPSNLFASIAGQTYVFPDWLNTAAKVMTLVGMAVILVMSGRGHKNWGIRIALGAYDIYGVTSWLSDVLSYSRLLALGLATGVIANVINMIASMPGKSAGGVIVFIIVFIFGHALNIGINMLGAYVHTNRLQYVEFFGKFYDAGGTPFLPFKDKNKYVEIKEEN